MGDGSDERLRAAGAHSRLSPKPPLTGDALVTVRPFHPADLRQDHLVLLASAHWGLPEWKFETFCVGMTPPALAKPWQWVIASVQGRPAGRLPQRQNEVLHKVLLPPFLSRKGGYQAATEPSQRGSVPAASRPLSVRQMICPRPMSTFRLAISTSWPISSRPKATWAGTSRSS